MKCLSCHYLTDGHGEPLQASLRLQFEQAIPESGLEIYCLKAMEDIAPVSREMLEQVTRERRCRGFAPYRRHLNTLEMLGMESASYSRWQKAAIAIALVLIVGGLVGTIPMLLWP